MRPECEQFRGRKRDLCEGRGFDGRLHPTQGASDHFRLSRGMHSIEVQPPAVPNTDPSPKGATKQCLTSRATPRKSSIGDTLSELFKSRVGQTPCGWCKDQIVALNRMTAAEVMEIIDDLTTAIVNNAKEKGNWWVKLSIWADEKGHAGIVESVVKSFIREACEREGSDAAVKQD